MTKASDAAYTEAKRLIAAARDSGATELALNTEETRALTQIPPEISTLTALTMLDLSGTQVADLRPLSHLTALTTLDLGGTQITDLRPLSQLTTLTMLFLTDTSVTDLGPLTHLTALSTLYLSGTPVTDLNPLTHLTALTTLHLRESPVIDLNPLTHLTALTMLDLISTPVTDLRPLLLLTRLATDPEFGGLSFANTPFARLPPFDDIAAEKDPATRAQRLFAALQGWVPPDPPAVDEQEKTGLRYGVGPDGVLRYAKLPEITDPSLQQRQLHALLVEDAADLLFLLNGGGNPAFARIASKMERYADGLGSSLHDLSAVPLWSAGNNIRLLLRADAEKKRQFVNEPTLDPGTLAALQGFVATHNAFSAIHPDLVALDHAQIDPAERHKAEQDRALLEKAIDVFAVQTRLILEEVTQDLRDLHLEAAGNTDAALRAMKIEIDSIENLVKAILAQATIDARSDTFLSRVAGDVRSAAVGAGVSSAIAGASAILGPEIAATFPQLVYTLQPQLIELLMTLRGQSSALAQSAEWVAARLTQALKK